jgi:cupin 2 domain-containing protein
MPLTLPLFFGEESFTICGNSLWPKAVEIKNLFAHISDSVPEEVIEVLPKTENFRLERIVSDGQATPPGEWYDQETHEWVLLLKGSAGLRLAGEPGIRVMRSGDALHIPEHLRHRVEWTEGGIKTIWLALPSDTPRRAGGLMNGAASKAVALFTQSWD